MRVRTFLPVLGGLAAQLGVLNFAEPSAAASLSTSIPVADGFVTDSNFDGIGDIVNDGTGIVVGFNTFGVGEQRAVYEFSLAGIPQGAAILSAGLLLNHTGSREEAIDPFLSLYFAEERWR